MNKIKKILPELRFPEFKDAGEWEEKKLGEILIKNSTKNKKQKYSLVQSVSNKFGLINQEEYFENRRIAGKDTSNYYVIKKGYFAYNPSRIDVGSLAYKYDNETSIISPLYVSFKADNKLVLDYFLLNWFDSENFTKQMIFEGGVRNTLNYESLIQIKILLPPSINEQQRIAACLSSLDELISAHSQKLELLKAHKKGLMQNLFPQEGKKVPKLRFKEFEDSGEWKEETLGKVYDFKSTNSLSREHLSYEKRIVKNIHYGDIHTTFSTLFDITKEKVPFIKYSVPVKIKKDNYCIEGDIIFADASEDIDDIGKSIEIINLNNEKLVSGLHTLLARQRKQKLAIGFGGYLFKSDWVRKQIQREAQGAKVLGISATRISRIRILFPQNIIEQQKIASCLSSLDELITAQSKKIEQLKQHKKGLMQGLFPKINE
ncbi:MAG: restriction endonuclease subunit S [Flavobacteriaceae bacterium]|nr:restriction endonuclease subunit S [Flavobacteriaceae bacterium]